MTAWAGVECEFSHSLTLLTFWDGIADLLFLIYTVNGTSTNLAAPNVAVRCQVFFVC